MTADALIETLTLISKITAGGVALCSLGIFLCVRSEIATCRLALAYKRGEKDISSLSAKRRHWLESADEKMIAEREAYWQGQLIIPVIFAALTFFLLALLLLLWSM